MVWQNLSEQRVSGSLSDRLLRYGAAMCVLLMAVGLTPLAPSLPSLGAPTLDLVVQIVAGAILATAAGLCLLGRPPLWSAVLSGAIILVSVWQEGRFDMVLALLAGPGLLQPATWSAIALSIATPAAALAIICFLRLSLVDADRDALAPASEEETETFGTLRAPLAPQPRETRRARPSHGGSVPGTVVPRRVSLADVPASQRTPRPQPIASLSAHRSRPQAVPAATAAASPGLTLAFEDKRPLKEASKVEAELPPLILTNAVVPGRRITGLRVLSSKPREEGPEFDETMDFGPIAMSG